MTTQEIEALRVEALKDKVEALSDMVEILKAERDALAARIQTAERIEKIFSETPELTFDDCLKLFAIEIREIKAEAGRAGFAAGVYAVEIAQILGSHDFDAEKSADEYAESLSQGTA